MKLMHLARSGVIIAALIAAVPAMASSGLGVTSVSQQGDMVFVQVNTPVPAKLEVISGEDVFRADIPAGDREVSIPRTAIDDMLTDSNSDIFMLRGPDGQPIGSGVRVLVPQRGARDHSPYLAVFVPEDHPDAEAMRQMMSTIPN